MHQVPRQLQLVMNPDLNSLAFLVFPLFFILLAILILTLFPFLKTYFIPSHSYSTKLKIGISLSDAYSGNTIKRTIKRNVQCPVCNGSGAAHSHAIHKCSKCGGKGVVKENLRMGLFTYEHLITCPICGGSGNEITEKCEKCNGSGRVSETTEFNITIPKGSKTGDILKIKNMGEMGSMLLLLLTVNDEEKNFKRQGDDLLTNLTITLKDALLGFKKQIPHLDGHQISIEQNGVTSDGQIIRIKGEGMKKNFLFNGDCLISIHVDMHSISPDQALKIAKVLNQTN
ncbi:chaperone proteinDNAJ, putative [Entamoeba histolytica HM-3:IMSS]|uniref:Chaperone proteinDNAJ, putative n=1 Tax=Entamoeba histolytica HM-3:IMSS TaxID=885315 RepID=M7WJF9_ENTHI|nr:chaperone proteinDNAJ, putative [Entamoeba histolytica HM-3:IMSS]